MYWALNIETILDFQKKVQTFSADFTIKYFYFVFLARQIYLMFTKWL